MVGSEVNKQSKITIFKSEISTSDSKNIELIHIPESNFYFTYHRTIAEINRELNSFHSEDLFHQSSFYKALEEKSPKNTFYRYCIIYDTDKAIGFFYYQIKKINLGESLDSAFPTAGVPLWIKMQNIVRKRVASLFSFYTLVNGNMMQTGQYGHYIMPEYQSRISGKITLQMAELVAAKLEKENIKTAGILLKDFYAVERFVPQDYNRFGYTEFEVQPNMILDIKPEWKSIEDYMSDMRSKYRVRTRRTWKKLNGITKRELTLDDLEVCKHRMHEMYKNIALNASFNLFILDVAYFLSLKKHLGEKCKIIGYYLNERMVAFYTILYNDQVLDAHFLGYDPEVNTEMHLYHNMLYDLVDEGIMKKADHIDFSRTAMAIKSSVGAFPKDMFLYLKIRNKFLNRFTGKLLPFLTPQEEWVQRSPFK